MLKAQQLSNTFFDKAHILFFICWVIFFRHYREVELIIIMLWFIIGIKINGRNQTPTCFGAHRAYG